MSISPTNSIDDDDLFGARDWMKAKANITKDGYRDGLSDGQESKMQDAFNRGYKDIVGPMTTLSSLRGNICAISSFTFNKPGSLKDEQEKELRIMLNEISEMEKNLITQIGNSTKDRETRSVGSTSLTDNSNPQYSSDTASKFTIDTEELTGDCLSRSRSEDTGDINCGPREATSESKNFNMKRENTLVASNPDAYEKPECNKTNDEKSLRTSWEFDIKDSIKIEDYRTKLKTMMMSLKMSK